jgi:hypothetical protein
VRNFESRARQKAVCGCVFPDAPYFSFQLCDSNRDVLGGIDDVPGFPEVGNNNPYLHGTAQGTCTIFVVFCPQPPNPPPNTTYTGYLNENNSVGLVYRIYYSDRSARLARRISQSGITECDRE